MNKERDWIMGMHLSQLAFLVVPFGGLIAPTVIWLMKRDEFPEIAHLGKQILNFQISFAIASLIICALNFSSALLLGQAGLFSMMFGTLSMSAMLSLALWIVGTTVPIFAAYRVSQGQDFKYPAVIRPIH